jgi:hypothetical protein
MRVFLTQNLFFDEKFNSLFLLSNWMTNSIRHSRFQDSGGVIGSIQNINDWPLFFYRSN